MGPTSMRDGDGVREGKGRDEEGKERRGGEGRNEKGGKRRKGGEGGGGKSKKGGEGNRHTNPSLLPAPLSLAH